MQMKFNRYLTITALFFGLLSSSCNAWLDVRPENTQTVNEYWKTGDQVEAVLASGYYYLRDSWQYMYFWAEARGNGMEAASLSQNDASKFLSMRYYNTLPTSTYAKWEKMYKVIAQANSVIKYAPEVVKLDESFSENVMRSLCVEAYWLRAYCYFTLVRNFRDVPLCLEPYVDDEADFLVPQSSPEIVLQTIIDDLENNMEYAKEYFPETDPELPVNTKGRATRWALKALLADIYLWRGNAGDYQRAAQLCDEVINSGRVGLIAGNQWFTNFFPGNSNESIFEIQYDNSRSQTNNFLTIFNTNTSFVISPNSKMLFDKENDLRYPGTFGTTDVFLNWKFIGRDDISTTTRLSTENDQNWILYRLADIYLMKAEAKVMQGDYASAFDALNAVRTRAGIDIYPTVQEEETALRLILSERQREFISEGKSWYDILRIGRRNEYQYKNLMIQQVLLEIPASMSGRIRSILSDVNAHYLPIPSDELKANPLLKQNPYYENMGN